MPAKFEVYKDKSGQYRFRFMAGNNEIVAVGESYKTKESCLKGISVIKVMANSAEILDITGDDVMLSKGAKSSTKAAKKAPAKKKAAPAKKAVKKAAPKVKKSA